MSRLIEGKRSEGGRGERAQGGGATAAAMAIKVPNADPGRLETTSREQYWVEEPGQPHRLQPGPEEHSRCWRNQPEVDQRFQSLSFCGSSDIRSFPSRNLLLENFA